MGADNFIVYFGLRYEITSEAELESLERRDDPRLKAVRQARLAAYFGRPTEGEPYFLLIGTGVGQFGVQGTARMELSEEDVRQAIEVTRQKLSLAGIEGEPRFHLQLEGQH